MRRENIKIHSPLTPNWIWSTGSLVIIWSTGSLVSSVLEEHDDWGYQDPHVFFLMNIFIQ